MKKPPKMNRAEIVRRVDEEWSQMLERSGLGWSRVAAKKMLRAMDLPPETIVAYGVTWGAALGLSSLGDEIAHEVKSQEQLEEVLQGMRERGEEMPTLFRKAVKDVVRALPRRGGPGRQPKLSPKEASLMCDQISLFIRQKMKLKQALQKASELSPSLLGGKKVSPRTLQKAWDSRDKFPYKLPS
jgi:hypothetical protein